MRVLIADDEAGITKALKVILEKNKFTVDAVYNGTDALDYIMGGRYDAIVLDIMMPGLDGLEVLRRARSGGVTTPVLLLTAKSDVSDRVAGLDCGADDYLPKPFATSELVARVRALTRRSERYTHSVLAVGKTTLDSGRYELSCGDARVGLSNREYQLMELLMRNAGQVFSSERIMELIWGFDAEAETDVVWTYISFLRKKLREINADTEIKTIRGVGYALTEQTR